MAGRGPRGSYANGVQRRDDIVRAALEGFAAKGFYGTSLRAIAAQVGISHVGVAHHFASKEELLLAVLDHRDELTNARLQDVLPPALEDVSLAVLLESLVRVNQETPHLRRLYATLEAEACEPEHPAHEYFAARCAMAREQLARLPEVQAAAAARQTDPELVAGTVLAVLDGLQVQWLLDPDVDELGAMRAFLSLMLPSAQDPQPAQPER